MQIGDVVVAVIVMVALSFLMISRVFFIEIAKFMIALKFSNFFFNFFVIAYPTRRRQAKSVFDAFRDFQAEAS